MKNPPLLPTIYEDIIEEVEELGVFHPPVWAQNFITREWCHVPTWWEDVFSWHLSLFQESIATDVCLPYATLEETKELKHFLCYYPTISDIIIDQEWGVHRTCFTIRVMPTVPTEPWVLPVLLSRPELREQGLPVLEFSVIFSKFSKSCFSCLK